jgi:hypothetical protein
LKVATFPFTFLSSAALKRSKRSIFLHRQGRSRKRTGRSRKRTDLSSKGSSERFPRTFFSCSLLREDSGQIRSFYRMLRSALALCAIMGASAFAGMGLKLPHDANSRMALRSAGPSMKIGVFYGSTTGNTENVAVQVCNQW